MGESFKQSYGMTIGADFAVYKMDDYTLHIWDLAGQIRFSQILKSYYIGAVGSLLVFDITKKESFQNLSAWIEELVQNNNNKIIPMVVVGNKSDLRNSTPNAINIYDIQRYVKKLSEWTNFEVPYIETSALSGLNVENTFRDLVERIDASNP
jgi:Ras-related protein Rab-11A